MISEELTAEIENAIQEQEEGLEEQQNDVDPEDNKEEEISENKEKDTRETRDNIGGEKNEHKEMDKAYDDDVYVYEEDINDLTIERAINLGFTPEDVSAFPTERSLITACVIAERSRQSNIDEADDEENIEESNLDKIVSGMKDDEYETEVIEVIKAIKEEIENQRGEIKALKGGQSQFEQTRVAQATAEIERWFDSKINSLGDNFSEILGSGSHRSLDHSSDHYKNREAIAEQITILLAGYESANKEPPPIDDLFDMAVKYVLADEIAELEQKKIVNSLDLRSKNHISRPSGRKTKSTSEDPEDEVAKILDEKYFKK